MQNETSNLTGKIIISTPAVSPDSYFAKSVIYISNHNKEEGAIGLVINHPISELPKNLYIKNPEDQSGEDIHFKDIKSYAGGPVDLERGFILHSNDYNKNVLEKNQSISLSSNMELVKDIMKGKGPKNSLFLLGYCGWDPGQLEEEFKENMWIEVEQNKEIIFDTSDYFKWEHAINTLKINPANFSSNIGHC